MAPPAKPAGEDLPPGIEWHERTRIWWDKWRRSGQAPRFQPTDWEFLLETALIHTAFWNGDLSAAGELRLRVAKFGSTPEDRARLRLEVTDGPPAANKKPAKAEKPDGIAERRRAAMRLVNGGKAS